MLDLIMSNHVKEDQQYDHEYQLPKITQQLFIQLLGPTSPWHSCARSNHSHKCLAVTADG